MRVASGTRPSRVLIYDLTNHKASSGGHHLITRVLRVAVKQSAQYISELTLEPDRRLS